MLGRDVCCGVTDIRGKQIISILDIIKPPSIEQFKEVYCAWDPLPGHGHFLCPRPPEKRVLTATYPPRLCVP